MSKYRVMVVDDDPDIRFVTSGLLGDDFEMVQAESGLDALEKIERYEPDLLLLDLHMPIMDGFATCRGIRRHGQFSDMPVFFLTGASSDDARRRASEAQSQGFVEKPFDTDALVHSIRDFFTNARTTPRIKTFTMRDLKKIDATPLRSFAAECAEEAEAAPAAERPSGMHPLPGPEDSVVPGKGRTRRVFGAAAKQPPPAAPPAPAMPEEDAEPRTKRVTLPAEILRAARRSPDEAPIPRPKPALPPEPAAPEPGIDPDYPQLPKKKAFTLESDSGFFESAGPKPPAPAPPPQTPPPVAPPRPAAPAPEPTPRAAEPPPPPMPARHSSPTIRMAPRPAAPLPEPTPAVVPARPRREVPAAARAGAASGARPRVLCVIAEPAEMNAYALALKGLGEFLPLQDPVEAVEIIARFQPDIVFVRMLAKEFSGIQLATLLKSNPRIAHTEVLFLDTGRETPQQQAAAARVSANPTVRIPIDENTVRNAVKRTMDKPGFAVREKKLPYGTYVTEVLQAERGKAEALRQAKEKEFDKQRASALGDFMAELHKTVGNKAIPESMLPKTAQAYYLS